MFIDCETWVWILAGTLGCVVLVAIVWFVAILYQTVRFLRDTRAKYGPPA